MKPKSIRTPIFRDTGFHLVDIPTIKQAFSDELGYPRNPDLYIYSRYRNPNVVAAESMIMQIEECEWTILTQSGLAAIDTALSIFQENSSTGTWLFFSEIYGGTNHYTDNILIKRRGIDVIRFTPRGDKYSLEDFRDLVIKHKPRVVLFEAITNPMLIAVDAESVIRIAKEYGAVVIVDNTFATPYLWKPLKSGADLVIHSVTKYLAGHGNISAGAICGDNNDLLKRSIEYRKLVGHMLSPDDAARLCDQLKTFELRMQKHCSNAMALAKFLQSHRSIERVLYPGLESHTTHTESNNLFKDKGYGAIITFDLAGDINDEKAKRCGLLIDTLRDSIPLVPTLGDAETILMPIEPVWGDKYPYPGMIRLSVGIEDIENLKSVIGKALDTLI